MWRKTTTHYAGDPCQGTDANRNCKFLLFKFFIIQSLGLTKVYNIKQTGSWRCISFFEFKQPEGSFD